MTREQFILHEIQTTGRMSDLIDAVREWRRYCSRNTIYLAFKNPNTITRKRIVQTAETILQPTAMSPTI